MEDKKVFVPVEYNNDQKIIFKDVSDETLSFLDSISHVTHYSYLNRTYIPAIMFEQDDVNINTLTSDGQLEERSLSELVTDYITDNPNCIKAKLIQAQIDILNSLFDRGLKNVYQAMTSPVNVYKDVINPLIKELQKELDNL